MSLYHTILSRYITIHSTHDSNQDFFCKKTLYICKKLYITCVFLLLLGQNAAHFFVKLKYNNNNILLFCRAKAKVQKLRLWSKMSYWYFWDIQDILYHVHKYLERIMGSLKRNFEKPRGNQGRALYNTGYSSFTLFGTLKMSYSTLPLTTQQN